MQDKVKRAATFVVVAAFKIGLAYAIGRVAEIGHRHEKARTAAIERAAKRHPSAGLGRGTLAESALRTGRPEPHPVRPAYNRPVRDNPQA